MKPPFSINTPLTQFPYNSRVSKNEFETLEASKNYVLCAFTPGNPLQASELNEIQESFYKNLTLHNLLLKNWLFIGDETFTSGDEGLPLYGPSWRGAVPLNPSSVTLNQNTITFKMDWYLVDDISGIKFWIYNNTEKSIVVTLQDVIYPLYIGMVVKTEFMTTSTGGPDDAGDADLRDNSGGYTQSLSIGADRYTIQFENTYQFQSDTIEGGFRPIVSIDPDLGVYRYLNNLLLTN